jgi:hypothetical protein
MNVNEAVILFKNDCFSKTSWERTALRYQGKKSLQTLVRYITENYEVIGTKSEIESCLRTEFDKAIEKKDKK